MGLLAGRHALVTGGSRGIGRAVVERFAREGAAVAFTFAQRADAAEDCLTSLRKNGVDAEMIQADFSDPTAAERAFAAASAALGGLDIVVNNAAVVEGGQFESVDAEAFDRVMDANAKAVFLMLRCAARELRDGGRIVNVSSLNTRLDSPGTALYAASKAAVEQFAVVAARELGPRGITVNCVSPGATDTDMLRGSNPPEALEQMAARSPLGRIGAPEDVADVITFLASDEGRWITGQNILASGGFR